VTLHIAELSQEVLESEKKQKGPPTARLARSTGITTQNGEKKRGGGITLRVGSIQRIGVAQQKEGVYGARVIGEQEGYR